MVVVVVWSSSNCQARSGVESREGARSHCFQGGRGGLVAAEIVGQPECGGAR